MTFDAIGTNVETMVMGFKRGVPYPDETLSVSTNSPMMSETIERMSRTVSNLGVLLEPRRHYFFGTATNSFGSTTEAWKDYARKLRTRFNIIKFGPSANRLFIELAPYGLMKGDATNLVLTNKFGTNVLGRGYWKGPAPTAKPFFLGSDGERFFQYVGDGDK